MLKLTFFVTLACLPLALDFYISDDLSLLYHAATSERRANSKALSYTYCCGCHSIEGGHKEVKSCAVSMSCDI